MVVYTLEQRWEILRQIDLQKMSILAKKKSSFQLKLILILAGMLASKIMTFGAQKTRTHTLKSRRTQNESLFVAGGQEQKKITFSDETHFDLGG